LIDEGFYCIYLFARRHRAELRTYDPIEQRLGEPPAYARVVVVLLRGKIDPVYLPSGPIHIDPKLEKGTVHWVLINHLHLKRTILPRDEGLSPAVPLRHQILAHPRYPRLDRLSQASHFPFEWVEHTRPLPNNPWHCRSCQPVYKTLSVSFVINYGLYKTSNT